jgi:hypothetical protein
VALVSGNYLLLLGIILTCSVVVESVNVKAWEITLEPLGTALTSAVFLVLTSFPILAVETALLLSVLNHLPRCWSVRKRRLAALIGALAMGSPFYLLEIQESQISVLLFTLIVATVFGLLMIVPVPTTVVAKREGGVEPSQQGNGAG